MNNFWKAAAILSGVGIYIAAVIFICLYLGGLVDDFFQLGGKGRIIGIILGFPIAIYSVYRQLKHHGFI
ncbi:MAG: AtpZ/AtpI family protein [Quinella sp. 3Q1]|nr:AtpZ/AtpI family protein [Quinella sp. 3Q1]MBQ4404022.1 AtpZ/AtpI family protein [Selenomonadaceae bacterium]MBR3051642.1 AtpZ/AtpI family protein [Selenomonadaceae bacterium]MBR6888677.1 AtpZ/AtpI family protein [Selenomonadaceae bacterium]